MLTMVLVVTVMLTMVLVCDSHADHGAGLKKLSLATLALQSAQSLLTCLLACLLAQKT